MQAIDMEALAKSAIAGAHRVFTSVGPWVWIVEATYRSADDEIKRL